MALTNVSNIVFAVKSFQFNLAIIFLIDTFRKNPGLSFIVFKNYLVRGIHNFIDTLYLKYRKFICPHTEMFSPKADFYDYCKSSSKISIINIDKGDLPGL